MTLRPRFSSASIAVCLVAGVLAPRMQASGFQLREQSASAQGNAFAGITAGGEDASAIFFNPAGMTRFQDTQFVLGTSYVAPVAKFTQGSASRAPVFQSGQEAITGSPSHPNSAQSVALPVLAAVWSPSDFVRLGLSINVPFGMATNYNEDYLGRYHARKSDLKVIDIAPSIAIKLNGQWSAGLALIARKASAEISNAVDFGAIAAHAGVPGAIPGTLDGTATLKGDAWGYGLRVGITYQPLDSLRFGLAHHAAMSLPLDGTTTFSGVPAILASRFQNGNASAQLDLPSTSSLGIEYQATETLTLLGEAARTDWSCFQELRVRFHSGLDDSITREEWRDTWYAALGLRWKLGEATCLRAGLAIDQGAAKDSTRTPRIPDGDRTWASLGAGHSFTKAFSMDLGYTHIFVKSSAIGLASGTTSESPDFYRGNLSGEFRNHIDILAIQGRYRF